MSKLQSEQIEDTLHVTLPRILDIPAVVELRESILELAESGMTISIQSDAVEQVTTPGVQVLMAVAGYVERKNAKFTVVKPSEPLVDGFSDLGLFAQFMAWNVE